MWNVCNKHKLIMYCRIFVFTITNEQMTQQRGKSKKKVIFHT